MSKATRKYESGQNYEYCAGCGEAILEHVYNCIDCGEVLCERCFTAGARCSDCKNVNPWYDAHLWS